MRDSSTKLGTDSTGKLLLKMAFPATIGMLVMVFYNVTDTVFVSKFVGSYAVGGMAIVSPITMLISVLGMSIGIGGGAIIAKRLGKDDLRGANKVLGNMVVLGLVALLFPTIICYLFEDTILAIFGATGQIFYFAKRYYHIVIVGAPILGFAMMFNNALRSEGKAKETMLTMIFSAIVNVGLDYYLILVLDMGIEGAALATLFSQVTSLVYVLAIYFSKRSVVKLNFNRLRLDKLEISEIASIGASSIARQGSFSVLSVVINHTLLQHGGEFTVAVYGVINRVVMMAVFPIFGIAQGLMPIVSYNLGAGLFKRISSVLLKAVFAATCLSFLIFLVLFFRTSDVMSFFTDDPEMKLQGAKALKIIVLMLPSVGIQVLGAVYFQAIGRAKPALLLTLLRQIFLLIPSVIVLPFWFGVEGVWYAFPFSDLIATLVTFFVLIPSVIKFKYSR